MPILSHGDCIKMAVGLPIRIRYEGTRAWIDIDAICKNFYGPAHLSDAERKMNILARSLSTQHTKLNFIKVEEESGFSCAIFEIYEETVQTRAP